MIFCSPWYRPCKCGIVARSIEVCNSVLSAFISNIKKKKKKKLIL